MRRTAHGLMYPTGGDAAADSAAMVTTHTHTHLFCNMAFSPDHHPPALASRGRSQRPRGPRGGNEEEMKETMKNILLNGPKPRPLPLCR